MNSKLIRRGKAAVSLLGLAALVGLVACGGSGGDGSISSSSSTNTVSGSASMGPFVTGAAVTAKELDATTGEATGTETTTKVTDDLGSYSLSVSWTGPTLIEITGDYFDESTADADGNMDTATADSALSVVTNVLSDGTVNEANVNTLTHIAASRIQELMAEEPDTDFATHQQTADAEVALDVLGVELGSTIRLEDLNPFADATNLDSSVAELNAQLLVFDTALLQIGSTPVDLLSTMATDMKTDGAIDSQGTNDPLGQVRTNRTALETALATDSSTSQLAYVITGLGKAVTAGNETATVTSVSDLQELPRAPVPTVDAVLNNYAASNSSAVSSVTISPNDPDMGDTHTFSIIKNGTKGITFAVDANTGVVTYTLDAGATLQVDQALVRVEDSSGASGVVVVQFSPRDNVAPTATADPSTVDMTIGTTTSVTITGADTDADDTADMLTYSLTSALDSSVGTVTQESTPNVFSVTASDSAGSGDFVVTVTDTVGATGTAKVTVNVTIGPVAPTVTSVTETTEANTAKVVVDRTQDFVVNGSDANGDSITFSALMDNSGAGTVVEKSGAATATSNTFTFTAASNEASGKFTVTALDNSADALSSTVDIFVSAVANQAPQPSASPDSVSVEATGSAQQVVTISGNDPDEAESELVSFEITTPLDSAVGTVAKQDGSNNVFVVTGGTTAGSGSFVVTVTDQGGLTGTVTIPVTVTAEVCESETTSTLATVTVSHDNSSLPKLTTDDASCADFTCVDVQGITYTLISSTGLELSEDCYSMVVASGPSSSRTAPSGSTALMDASTPTYGTQKAVFAFPKGFSSPINLHQCIFTIPSGTCSAPTSADFSLQFESGTSGYAANGGGVVDNGNSGLPDNDFKITVENN